MLNTLKLQLELIKFMEKSLYKTQKDEYYFDLMNIEENEYILICKNRHIVYLIESKYFFLDISKMEKSNFKRMNLKRFITSENNLDCVYTDGTIKPLKGDKRKVQVFKNKEQEILINIDMLKLFELDDCSFKGTNNISPVYIYNNLNKLIGLVLPIRR